MLTDADVIAIVVKLIKQRKDSISQFGAADMGKVMAAVKAQLAGQAEMALVSVAVKKALSK